MKNYLFVLGFLSVMILQAQDRFENVLVSVMPLTDHTFLVEGSGGNILIYNAGDELLMIDSQFAPLSAKIKDAIAQTISKAPISYLINTHHHGDHTGGNANFNTEKTTIVAQENATKRVAEQNKDKKATPEKSFEEELEIEIGKGKTLLIHVHNAHTDGDTFVYIVDENVVHLGDVFFNGAYPYIDLKSGGSINGYIAAQEKILEIINTDTLIVPGHGALASYENLQEYIPMLISVRDRIQEFIDNGATKEEIIANETITQDYDNQGYGDGFINSKSFRETVYSSLTASL